MSFASFLAFVCFFRSLLAEVAAAVLPTGSIYSVSVVAAQILDEGFWREKSGLCATGGRDRQGNWAEAGRHTRYPGRCKLGPNLVHRCPCESVRLRRTAEECEADALVRLDRFGHARNVYIGPVEMP
jgi:hypothetical protein